MGFYHETEALVKGISALMKKTPESAFCLLPCEDTVEKMATYETGSRLSPGTESDRTLILTFSASRAVRIRFMLVISHRVYGMPL